MIPKHIEEAFDRYVNCRISPGDFLQAVLSNDLKGSFMLADDENRENLFDIVSYVYNELPFNCQGSPEKVKKWLRI